MPLTIKQCVFSACDLIGDQSSLDHLQEIVRRLYDELDVFSEVVSQYEIAIQPFEATIMRFAKTHKVPDMGLTCTLSHFLDVPSECSDLLFDLFCRQFPTVVSAHHKMMRELTVSKRQIMQYRLEWRKKNGSHNDCRTYRGQPDRNMICA